MRARDSDGLAVWCFGKEAGSLITRFGILPNKHRLEQDWTGWWLHRRSWGCGRLSGSRASLGSPEGGSESRLPQPAEKWHKKATAARANARLVRAAFVAMSIFTS